MATAAKSRVGLNNKRNKINQKTSKNITFFSHGFWDALGWISEGFWEAKIINFSIIFAIFARKKLPEIKRKKKVDFGGQDGDFGGQEGDFGGQREQDYPPYAVKKDNSAECAGPLAKLESDEFSLELRKVSYACHP